MLKALSRLVLSPNHFLAHKNIFLFSHMRANTSLFGHVLGSHPDIEGYYEMHIGYYSWKSLWRQKLLYLKTHKLKPNSFFFFDKLLHDYCVVAPEILARPSTKSIFMLRGPEKSIKSIVGLYRKIDPKHEFAGTEGATDYYLSRIRTLSLLAQNMPNHFYYLDADDLINHTEDTLLKMSAWLGLSQPLSPEYKMFNKTGAPQAGDPSELMKSGKISKQQHDYPDIELDKNTLAQAIQTYSDCRAIISQQNNCTLNNKLAQSNQ